MLLANNNMSSPFGAEDVLVPVVDTPAALTVHSADVARETPANQPIPVRLLPTTASLLVENTLTAVPPLPS